MGISEISIFKDTIAASQILTVPDSLCAIWIEAGPAEINGLILKEDEGGFFQGSIDIHNTNTYPITILRFQLTQTSMNSKSSDHSELLLSAPFTLEDEKGFLRLDKVSFPPGARAYRHIHPGPGIRYLSHGKLEIRSAHETTVMKTGQAWFEDANSPVQATADKTGQTQFIRAMILPETYFGKPTLKLLNPEDSHKPRLQSNHRYFDQMLDDI